MFMGTSPSTSSYEDQLLYFKPLIDEEGGGGGDENFRRRWGARFGFLEDPSAFVDTQEPNSEGLDLWTGNWGTDGVSMSLQFGANNLLLEEDWFVRNNPNARLNAAENEFDDERGRDSLLEEQFYISSGDELELDGRHGFAGVGYDDAMEIS